MHGRYIYVSGEVCILPKSIRECVFGESETSCAGIPDIGYRINDEQVDGAFRVYIRNVYES